MVQQTTRQRQRRQVPQPPQGSGGKGHQPAVGQAKSLEPQAPQGVQVGASKGADIVPREIEVAQAGQRSVA